MNATVDTKMPWVITHLGRSLFGLNCAEVREIVIMPEVCGVPGVPEFIRGVINLRGRVTPLVDLRRRLGMHSSSEETEELCRLMEQRAQDHRRWLEELEASVKENRKFTLARDPHQCAFGKWYDNFKTDNIAVSGVLKKFDAPHKRIHALANEIEELVEKGCMEQVLEKFEHARNGVLSTMLRLFADFQQTIRREIAVVLNGSAGAYAVSVDSVASVEKLSEAGLEELAGKGLEIREGLVMSVAKRAKTQELVLILATGSIFDPTAHAGILQTQAASRGK